ncbi:MAG: hypothetical protein IKT41_05425 [Clostridia bacterium]|nr:hypothetical protein [Clostridia bacterium]
MPNRKHRYRDMKKYNETRKKQKQRYYAKTAIYEPRDWIPYEDKLVLEHNMPDSELSSKIERSVAAIQQRRYVLRRCKPKKERF